MRKRIKAVKVAEATNDEKLSDVEFKNWCFRVLNKKKYSPNHYYNK